jgi:hypothetical protein
VVRPVPRNRQVVLDALTGAARRFPVHGLVEFDVGQARSRLAESQPPVSWTGFVVATMARAVALHPEVNAKNAKFLTRGMLWPAVGPTPRWGSGGGRMMDLCRQVVRWRCRKAAMRRWASRAEGSW